MSYDPCPHGHEPSTCEQCPRADLSAVLDREIERRRAASAPSIVGPRNGAPAFYGTNRHERRRAQALAVAAERRKARTAAGRASRKSGKEG